MKIFKKIFKKNDNNVLDEKMDDLKADSDENKFKSRLDELQSKVEDYNYESIHELERLGEKVYMQDKKIVELSSIVNRQEDTIKELQESLKSFEAEYEDKKEDKKSNVFAEILEENKNKQETIRGYSTSIREMKPKIFGITDDGRFIFGNGRRSNWGINHILYLKKLIPQTNLSMADIARKVKLNSTTCCAICCAIEDGDFDKYLQEWEEIKDNPDIKKSKTIRTYSKTDKSLKPEIKKLNKDGTFYVGNWRRSRWGINHILYLKKLIPQTNISMRNMSKKVKLSQITTRSLCCAIEDGDFDKYLQEWEQINANQFYKHKKPNVINNPQKRKENGYV